MGVDAVLQSSVPVEQVVVLTMTRKSRFLFFLLKAKLQLCKDVSNWVFSGVQDMGVDAVLQSSVPVEQGGVLTRTRRGQLCYDMAALTADLKQRCSFRN